jgi:hypothetical protein
MSVVDLHITHTISNGIKYFKDNEVKFNELFYDIGSTLRTTYFNKLNDIQASFDVALRKKTEKFPLITVSVEENSSDTFQMLGNRGFNEKLVLLVNQTCDVNIFADDLDTLRILHRVIQASMLIFKQNFLAIGYLNIQFEKASKIEIENELTTSNIDLYTRSITFVAQKQLKASEPVEEFDGPWELNPNIIKS